MRLSIREQLGLLVLFCSLIALMVLALAIWFQSNAFITKVALSSLSLAASLKSAQLSSTLLLYQSQVRGISTRVLIQTALQRYSQGNATNENWTRAQSDLAGALQSNNLLLQATIYPTNGTNQTALSGLVNVTSVPNRIALPVTYSNGSKVYLGDSGLGYPPSLYPNLTFVNSSGSRPVATVDGMSLDPTAVLLLGPLVLNDTSSLMSATTGIVNNTSPADLLGWVTILFDASMLYTVRASLEGLGSTGETLIVGPDTPTNRFAIGVRNDNVSTEAFQNTLVRYVIPPLSNSSLRTRHARRIGAQNGMVPFPVSAFPAVHDAWVKQNKAVNNAGSIFSTYNEQGEQVSVGYAVVATPMVDWILIVEKAKSEVQSPITHLRNVVLICVFCTVAGLMLATFPMAHYSVTPIRALRMATMKTVEPYQPDDSSGFTGHSQHPMPEDQDDLQLTDERKRGLRAIAEKFRGRTEESTRPTSSTRRRRTFRIPSKVPEKHHWITDELTELTSTFNEMSDELTMQYERLEERVKERTAELEKSKQAAEAANQSKTLFIANISHELKTPLNGILGLTTVCMNENDPSKVRSTLNTIYKSGDLLLNLLTDILTFSKNEVGQQLSIDEAEFRLSDLGQQLMPTFEKQAREAQIDLKVLYLGSNDAFGNSGADDLEKTYGPAGTGRVKDMCLWGDKNRILQVLMNFVSNSLKFTPPHGSVTVRVRCMGIAEKENPGSARKSSLKSTMSRHSHQSSRKKVRLSQQSLSVDDSKGEITAQPHVTDEKLNIHLGGGMAQIAKIVERQRQRSMSPPPLNTKDLLFELEVEDTGPGIPEEQQRKIFEPFVQGDLGLSKKYGGTGLGLSICVQLAALMGGEISLDSKLGMGSKFTMKIPLRFTCERAASMASSRRMSKGSSSFAGTMDDGDLTAPAAATANGDLNAKSDIPRIVGLSQPYVAKEVKSETSEENVAMLKKAEREAAREGRKVRVLVAEDNQVNQEVVLRMLKLEDIYDVTIAKDGQEAFDRVKESMESGERFHLVFMDVQMPNVDGIQSTKLIRRMGFSAPIVALTAFAEKSNEDECMASGMDYFLAKPIRRPQLKQVLKKYCTTIFEDVEGETSPGLTTGSTPESTVVGGSSSSRDSDKKSPMVNIKHSEDVSPLS